MLSTASRSENQLTVRDTAASQSTAGSQPMSVFAREMSAGVPRMSASRLGTANVTTGRTRTLRSALVFSTDLASPSGQPHPRVVRPRTRLRWSATTAEEAETMRDRELYATILGVTAPWTVDRVDLDVAAQRTALEAIAMDMWAPYVQATRAQVPDADAKIVFDRFHCAKHLNEGVDRVRRAEHRDLRARGDTRLTGTKYAWLRHPDHFTRPAWRAFAALRTSTLKVARAWALKETAADLWEYRYVGAAHRRRRGGG